MPDTTPRRTPRRQTVRRVSTFDLAFGGVLFLGLGAALPLWRGADPVTTLLASVLGILVGAAAVQLPDRSAFFAFFGGLLGGALVGSLLGVDELWYLSWMFSGVFLGGLIGVKVRQLRARGR